MATTTPEEGDRACFICGKPTCNIISHRLQSLEMSRRIERRESRSKSRSTTETSQLSELSQLRPLGKRQEGAQARSPLAGSVASSEDFPVKNATKTMIGFFNRFFASQQRSASPTGLLRSQEGLFFDSDHYRFLFSEAIQSAALCLSFVAMSATYIATHDRRVEAPDETLTLIYNRAFQSLRQQLRRERSSGGIPSESTVLAAINLSMACGVAFCDTESALTHWQGVLGLAPWSSRHYYSGALNIFLEQTMYWLTLVADVKPSFQHWPVVLPPRRQLPETYGHAWQPFFALNQNRFATARVHEFCIHVCRATEILENHATLTNRDLFAPPMTYFQYLRSMIEQQGALMFRECHNSSTAVEAAVIAVNIFYCLVLSATPWRTPMIYLCSQLQRAMTRSVDLNSAITSIQNNSSIDDSQLFSAWLLLIHLHAARLCRDEALLRWSEAALKPLLTQIATLDVSGQTWEKNLLEGMKRFCWSEMFMAGTFNQACDGIVTSRDAHLQQSGAISNNV